MQNTPPAKLVSQVSPKLVIPMRLAGSAILLCLSCFVATGQIVVAADGLGDFKTVQQAVDGVRDSKSVVIHIKPGVYHEHIQVSAGKRHITFRGEDPRKTVLTYRVSACLSMRSRKACATATSPRVT